MRRDLHSNIKTSRGIDPAVITAGNATLTSAIVDTADYDSLEAVVMSGVITDSTFTCTVFHGDASDMSDEAACVAADLIGTAPVFVATDDSVTKRVGYRGSKRYVRIKAVQSGATTGGYLASVFVQSHPRVAPVA